MTPQNLIDELTYRCYRYNRLRTPDITPTRWQLVFGTATNQLEQRYQAEVPLPVGTKGGCAHTKAIREGWRRNGYPYLYE